MIKLTTIVVIILLSLSSLISGRAEPTDYAEGPTDLLASASGN